MNHKRSPVQQGDRSVPGNNLIKTILMKIPSRYEGQERPGLVPKDGDKFDPDLVPGFNDGEYPRWMAQEMNSLLPKEILKRFGSEQNTMLNGSYWHLDPDQTPEILAALYRRGFALRERKDLMFW